MSNVPEKMSNVPEKIKKVACDPHLKQ